MYLYNDFIINFVDFCEFNNKVFYIIISLSDVSFLNNICHIHFLIKNNYIHIILKLYKILKHSKSLVYYGDQDSLSSLFSGSS